MKGLVTELWDTTYSDYGRFYKGKIEDSTARCEKKCEKLSRELKECHKKLNELQLRAKNDLPERRGLKSMLRYQSAIPNLRYTGYSVGVEEKDLEQKLREHQEKQRQLRHKRDPAYLERMRMEDLVNAYRYRQLYPAEYNMEHKFPSPRLYMDISTPSQIPEIERPAPLHPMVNRYHHYKFYGYGGHGAKTSWGHNLPLGRRVKHCKRNRALPPW